MSETPKEKTPIELAKEGAELKCAELKKKYNKEVYPLVFFRPTTKEIFIGFMQEPTRSAKMEAFDTMSAKESITLAGEIILSTSIIKEESHEAFYVQESKYDDVYMGGCVDALAHINVLINSLKKK